MRTRALTLLLAFVVATVLAACGIPEDSQPRDIPADALPVELADPGASSTSLTEGEGQMREVLLYLAKTDGSGAESLVPVPRRVRMPTDRAEWPKALTEALIASSPETLGRDDLVNAVPSDVQVRSATANPSGVLDLDLTNLGNVQSALQRLAVAQLVFTLTELEDPEVSSIRFSVDGAQVAVPVEGKVAPAGTAVGRADEPSFLD